MLRSSADPNYMEGLTENGDEEVVEIEMEELVQTM